MDVDISDRTIRRRLVANNLHGRAARKVPLLSKKNIAARLMFARTCTEWQVERWRNILWSDETKINLLGSDGSK